MLPLTSRSPSIHAVRYLTLAMALFVVAVRAQGQRDQFIIRVAELPNDLSGVDSTGDAQALEEFNLNFGNFAQNADTLVGGVQTELQAPDVVVEGLNLLQRNNLVAAAGNAQAPGPQQRIRMNLNSGLRRR
uniref:Uncharacterized protein n=1 Tax=Ceratitis capitata TaxID=7213 RepID=W8CE23_CERCA